MRDIIVTAIVFGLLPMALSRPYVGLYLYSWLSYMNPHKLTWGFATSMPFAYHGNYDID
jgi:putative inorganic carbon (hco3(-)) transporter